MGLESYAEVLLITINMVGYAAVYLLTETADRLAAVVELTAGDKVRNYCCPVNFKTAEETFPKPFRIGLRAFFFKKQAP